MKPPSNTRQHLLTAASAGLLLGGGWASFFAFQRPGQDFDSYRLMAEGVLRGINVYDSVARAALSKELGFPSPVGMFYPPATGFMVSPLALPSYDVAKTIWFLVMVSTVLFGIRALVRLAVPDAPPRVWMATSGLVLMSSSLRWGVMLLQGAPMVLGLLCFFVVALHTEGSRWPAIIAMAATAFKLTLALPFLGLLLLQRRFGAIALSLAVPGLLNALGFLRMGGGAFENYQHDIATLDVIVGDNMNSPDPWLPYALPRLDWVFLVYGFTANLAVARFVTLLASAGVGLWLLREMFRASTPKSLDTSAAFAAALVCLGSVCVYHHQYDVCPFIVPAVLGYFASQRLGRPRWAVISILPLLLMMSVLPIGKTQALVEPIFGSVGVGVLKLSFSVAVTFALVGSLAILRRHVAAASENRESQGGVEAPPT